MKRFQDDASFELIASKWGDACKLQGKLGVDSHGKCTQLPATAVSACDAFVRQGSCVLFPVLPVKGGNLDRKRLGVDVNAIRIGARNVKRLDAANAAKKVLGDARVKSVLGKHFGSTQKFEAASGDDQMQEPGFAADGAIALLDLQLIGGFKFKGHGSAMATSLVAH
jgi:hypothetical protein